MEIWPPNKATNEGRGILERDNSNGRAGGKTGGGAGAHRTRGWARPAGSGADSAARSHKNLPGGSHSGSAHPRTTRVRRELRPGVRRQSSVGDPTGWDAVSFDRAFAVQ